ncbi:MAG: hypothetical protein CMO01_12590 [Thalassobius sp.]|nr:hypothetical protein [Thalassovita sp.]
MEIEEINLKDLKQYQKHFSETVLWKKIRKLGEKAGLKVVYSSLLLYYAFKSDDVSLQAKATIVGALGYFILPFDFLPDFIPLIGFTDDLGALILAITQIKEAITPEIQKKAKEKLDDWFPQFEQAEIVEVDNAANVEDYSDYDWQINKPD